MICKNCGAEIADGSTFCTQCGAPVQQEQQGQPQQPVYTAAPGGQLPGAAKVGKILGTVGLIVSIVMAVVWFIVIIIAIIGAIAGSISYSSYLS